jgi:hypothetical protein
VVRTHKVPVTIEGRLILVALSSEEHAALTRQADKKGEDIRAFLRAVGAWACGESGFEPIRLAADRVRMSPTAWLRDVALHAVGHWPRPALEVHRQRAHRWAAR